jgi:hypothetical protein
MAEGKLTCCSSQLLPSSSKAIVFLSKPPRRWLTLKLSTICQKRLDRLLHECAQLASLNSIRLHLTFRAPARRAWRSNAATRGMQSGRWFFFTAAVLCSHASHHGHTVATHGSIMLPPEHGLLLFPSDQIPGSHSCCATQAPTRAGLAVQRVEVAPSYAQQGRRMGLQPTLTNAT